MAPKHLDVMEVEQTSILFKFIESIKVLSISKELRISFVKCEHISAPVLVYLYAQLEILRDDTNHKRIRISEPTLKGAMRAYLTMSGLVDMLKRQTNLIDPKKDVVLPIQSGSDPNGFESIVDHIQYSILKSNFSPTREHLFGDALSEVFGNVTNHAYPHRDNIDKKWWALCQVIEDQLFIVVYDSGIGIPKSIKKNHWLLESKLGDKLNNIGIQKAFEYLKIENDADKIEFAMQAGANRRKEVKHGQGSISMHALVEEDDSSGLFVFSNFGQYYNVKNRSQKKVYTKPIQGTLIQWNLSI